MLQIAADYKSGKIWAISSKRAPCTSVWSDLAQNFQLYYNIQLPSIEWQLHWLPPQNILQKKTTNSLDADHDKYTSSEPKSTQARVFQHSKF